MQKGERFRFVVIVGLVAALTSAGFALAGDALDASEQPQPTTCEAIDDTVEDGGTIDEGGPVTEEGETVEDTDIDDEDADTVDEGDQDESEECEDDPDEADNTDGAEAPADDEGVGVDGEVALQPTEERVKECTEAAGMTAADAPEEEPVPSEKKGLENAMAHVLWNCLRNDNDGLVNALEHLSDNLERKEFRDEAKEERKAKREAAKAEREAAKAERKATHEAAKLAREAARAS
jgi:hypothetical protein